MPTPTPPTCPLCGGWLVFDYVPVPEMAPWRCDVCVRSWWEAELDDTARAGFDRRTRSHWGREVQESIHNGANNEIARARRHSQEG